MPIRAGQSEPVSAKLVSFSCKRVKDDNFGGCATLAAAQGKTRKGRLFLCKIGDYVERVIFLDENDPERQIEARIVCLGDECDRKK